MASQDRVNSVSDARTVVAALRNDSGNAELHRRARAICKSESWGYLLEAGYVDYLAEYVNSLQQTPESSQATIGSPPRWVVAAWDISIALQASNTCSQFLATGPLNLRALAMIRQIIVQNLIPSTLWDLRGRLSSSGVTETTAPETSRWIGAASGLLFALSHSLRIHPDDQYMNILRNCGALELSTLCWYHTTELATRITGSIVMESLLSPGGRDPSTTPQLLAKVASVVPAKMIVKKSKQMLMDGMEPPGQMTDGHRLVELCLIQWLTDDSFKQDLGAWFGREDAQSIVAEVVRRILAEKQAGEKAREINWELVDMTGAVILNLSGAADLPVAMLIDYIERLQLLSMISQMYQDDSFNEQSVRAWPNLLDLFDHCITCNAPNCHYVRTDAYVNALRAALEANELWMQTIVKLQQLARSPADTPAKKEGRKQRLEAWYKLGKGCGLVAKLPLVPPTTNTNSQSEDVVPRDMIDGCWYGKCERHGSIDEGLTLARCSGCKTARYCSNPCQSADWKAKHKKECKIMRGKT